MSLGCRLACPWAAGLHVLGCTLACPWAAGLHVLGCRLGYLT